MYLKRIRKEKTQILYSNLMIEIKMLFKFIRRKQKRCLLSWTKSPKEM